MNVLTANFEVLGIGSVAIALFASFTGVILKMWNDHSKLTKRVIETIEVNAVSNEKLSRAIERVESATLANTEATKQSAAMTEKTKDGFSALLVEVIKHQRDDR